MNHLFSILIAISLTSCCYGRICDSEPTEFYTTEGTFYFINETSDTIISIGYKNIAPKDTFILHIKEDAPLKISINDPQLLIKDYRCNNMNATLLKKEKTNSLNNKRIAALPPPPPPVFYFKICNMLYKDGEILKEEKGLWNTQNYEDIKEVSPLVFEFTFRFTEERKAKAIFSGYYPIKAAFYFINETAEDIITDMYGNIAPKDTLKVNIGPLFGVIGKPDIDNFPLTRDIQRMKYKNGDVSKCEEELKHIIYYEDKKEVAPFSFEFTFRFTEEKKANAKVCSYY